MFVGIEHVSTVLASAPPPTLTPHWIEFDGVPPLRLVSHCHKHWCGLQSDGIVSLTTKTWFESSFAAETVGARSSDGGGGGGGGGGGSNSTEGGAALAVENAVPDAFAGAKTSTSNNATVSTAP